MRYKLKTVAEAVSKARKLARRGGGWWRVIAYKTHAVATDAIRWSDKSSREVALITPGTEHWYRCPHCGEKLRVGEEG